MTSDGRKGLVFSYNVCNLPKEVTSSASGSLPYTYLPFGTRMYDPFTARWTTADPLAAKYGSMSPYNYCGGNPANIVDPNGEDIWIWYNENGELKSFHFYGQTDNIPHNLYVKDVILAYTYNKENWEKAGFKEPNPSTEVIENHKYSVSVYMNSDNLSKYYPNNGGFPVIIWNPDEGLKTDTGVILSPATIFTHEADHAIDDLNNSKAHSERRSLKSNDIKDANKEEARVIQGSERLAAIANGEIRKGQATRRSYSSGTTVITKGPASTSVIRRITK